MRGDCFFFGDRPPFSFLVLCRPKALLLGFGGLFFFSVAPAQESLSVQQRPRDPTELTLDELMRMEIPKVYGASKYEQKTTEAPSSVTIVTSEEVKKFGHRTLADLLQSVRGLYVTYNRNYSFLGTRGFNRGDFNSRILLLVDGHRVNNSLSDGAFLGTEFILDVDLIDRVEVIRGPGSALYGNNAFFGVINVVTKRGDHFRGPEISGEVASFDTYEGRFTYGNRFQNGLEMLLSGTYYDSHGPLGDRADDDTFGSFFGSIGYSDFTLQGAFNSREKGVPTGVFGTVPDDSRTRTSDDRSYAALKFAHQFPDVVDVAAQIYYDRHDLTEDSFFNFTNLVPPLALLNREVQVGEWWGSEVQLTKAVLDRHTFTLGAEYRDDFRQKRRNFNLEPRSGTLGGTNRTTDNYGIYFQGDIGILTNLHFVGGVRYDKYGSHDPTVNPRLALIYSPVEKSVLKAIYGTAFRAPNFFERNLESPSRELDPETVTSYELVYEQGIGDHLRSSVSLFYNEIDDLISLQPDPLGGSSYQNVEGAEARGIETELEGKFPWGLIGRVSYSYQEAEDRESNRRLTDSPRHLGKLNVSVPFWEEKIFGGVEFQYTSGRKTVKGTEASGFGVINLTLFSHNIVKGLELSASVYNVLDRDYGDPVTSAFYPQDIIERDGRTFRVKLTYRF